MKLDSIGFPTLEGTYEITIHRCSDDHGPGHFTPTEEIKTYYVTDIIDLPEQDAMLEIIVEADGGWIEEERPHATAERIAKIVAEEEGWKPITIEESNKPEVKES